MSSRLRASVVICCFTEDRWDDLCAAIESTRRELRLGDEIVVSVDHCPPLARRLHDTYRDDLLVVENAHARGLSGARNTGVEAANGDIVVFLDDDAVAEPGWLNALCAPYADARVAVVGGKVVPNWDTERPSWFPPEFDWVVGCTYAGHPATGPVRNVIGANMSFRRSVFATVGVFDDRVGRVDTRPTGCEETELCIRVRQQIADAVIWYTDAAVVRHRVRAARATTEYFRARCSAEGTSKTHVARLVGSKDGLASERTYTTRTLPLAVIGDLGRFVRHGDTGAMARITMRVVGVVLTTLGFVSARLRPNRVTPITSAPAFQPALVAQFDLARPEPITNGRSISGEPYTRAHVLVREHGQPRGVLEVPFDGAKQLDAAHLTRIASTAFADATVIDLRYDDGLAAAPVAPTPVTVVVATRNRPEALLRCVDSILRSSHPDVRVVIVENAPSNELTRDAVHEHYGDNAAVTLLREDVPGLATAHNCGLRSVETPIVAFTDDDVVVDGNWISALVGAFAAAPDVACVTGMISPLELETPAQELVEVASGFNKGFERQVYRLRDADRHGILFPYAAGKLGSGANMAFRTDALRAMGGFDPALGTGTLALGGDDLASFFDTIMHGHALVYEPSAIVFHAHRRDDDALARQAYGYGAGLTAYLTRSIAKHPTRIFDVVRRVPAGLRHGLAPSSEKNARVPQQCRASISAQERRGMLVGPLGYVRSRLALRHTPHVRLVEPGTNRETEAGHDRVAS